MRAIPRQQVHDGHKCRPKIVIDISEVTEAKLRHPADAETAADLAAERASYDIDALGSLEPFSVAQHYTIEDVVAEIIDRAQTEYTCKG
jgi:hypothetical protein